MTAATDAASGFPVTVVLMPPSSSNKKRSAHPYGTYDMPSSPDVVPRRDRTEAILSPASPTSSSVLDLEDFPVITAQQDDKPVTGILPACFSSMSLCQSTTRNCSGHGSCVATHKGANNCYACACKPTKEVFGDDPNTVKHTYWGGPACQKKDVSIPFWLFVGTGIILSGLIAGGIGMLYSMGSEELPSVIGAGVSGPGKK
jgi:hypothetical protein